MVTEHDAGDSAFGGMGVCSTPGQTSGGGDHAEKPPSIVKLAPLMYVDAGDAR